MAVLDEPGDARLGVRPPLTAARSLLAETSNADRSSVLEGTGERMTGPLPENSRPPVVGLLAAPTHRIRSRRVILAGAALATFAAGGGIGYAVLKPSPPTPASTVQQYFDDLAGDDTAAALALVDGSDQVEGTTSMSLLSSRALASAASRPSDVRVGHTTTEFGQGSPASMYSVQVSYKIGGTIVSTAVDVVSAPAGSKSAYLLRAPFISLQIGDSGGRRVTVNGTALNVDDNSLFYAFPGAYTATAQPNALLAGDSESARLASDPFTGASQATIDFPAPRLAPGAQDAVKAQVKRQIDDDPDV
jgi:hypothetical protein